MVLQKIKALSVSFKISFLVIVGVILFGSAVMTSVTHILTDGLIEQTGNRLESSLAFMRGHLGRDGEKFVIKGEKLMIGTTVLNENFDLIDKLSTMGGGVMTVFQGDTRITTSVKKADGSRAVGTKLAAGPVYDTVLKQGKFFKGEAKILEQDYIVAYDPIKDEKGEVIGILFAGIKRVDQLAVVNELLINIAEISVLVGLLLVGVIYSMIRLMLKPIGLMEETMRRLQEDDVSVEVPAQSRRDEIGRMAKAVQSFKLSVIEKIKLRAEAEEQKKKAEADRQALLRKMAEDFELKVGGIVQKVASSANDLQSSARNLSNMSDQTNQQTTVVAAATEEASASVQTVASAAEELAASIGEINRQIEESRHVATGAVEEIKQTDSTVSTLSEAASQIGDVVKLIQDIAEQTNLLALNATIEAARAGDAGKGFAVVASEVKNLANQTARATEEISQKIVTIQGVSGKAVEAIRSIGKTIERIDDTTKTIAYAIQQQESATREISNNVQQASTGTSEISNSIVNVTHAAKESREASMEVLEASSELSKQAKAMREEVSLFVETVRKG